MAYLSNRTDPRRTSKLEIALSFLTGFLSVGGLLVAGFLVLAILGCSTDPTAPVEEAPTAALVLDTTTIPTGTAGSYSKIATERCSILEVRAQYGELRIIEACEVRP